MPRLYCPDLAQPGPLVLDGLEAHHLLHVLRGRCGDSVELFNGTGRQAQAEVVAVAKRNVTLRVDEVRVEPPASWSVTLATAVPKGDRFDWLIEKVTELGVTRLIPLTTARSVVDPRDSKLDKLRNTVIAACKQSGRNHLLEIGGVTCWSDFLAVRAAGPAFVADPDPSGLTLAAVPRGKSSLTFAVGPEGGFTSDEVAEAVNRGFQKLRLGPRILRIETAGVALAALALALVDTDEL